jgi:hypothetical protein
MNCVMLDSKIRLLKLSKLDSISVKESALFGVTNVKFLVIFIGQLIGRMSEVTCKHLDDIFAQAVDRDIDNENQPSKQRHDF